MERLEEGKPQRCEEGVRREREGGRIDEERETKGGYEGEEGREAESVGGSFRGERSSSDAFYPAFLRHIDKLWRLSLIINSLRFN